MGPRRTIAIRNLNGSDKLRGSLAPGLRRVQADGDRDWRKGVSDTGRDIEAPVELQDENGLEGGEAGGREPNPIRFPSPVSLAVRRTWSVGRGRVQSPVPRATRSRSRRGAGFERVERGQVVIGDVADQGDGDRKPTPWFLTACILPRGRGWNPDTFGTKKSRGSRTTKSHGNCKVGRIC